MKQIYFVLIIILTFFVSSCDKKIPDNEQDDFQEKLLQLVNDVRTRGCDCGGEYQAPVDKIVWNDTLAQVAEKHSKEMSDNNYFSHTGLNGSSPGDRMKDADYYWSTYGENIANGYTDEEAVIEGWLKSPGHCKNIMNGNFKEMGVGKSGEYWTQVFGTK